MTLQWGCSQHLAMSAQDERRLFRGWKKIWKALWLRGKCQTWSSGSENSHNSQSCLISWRINELISHIHHVQSGVQRSKGSYSSKVDQLTEKPIDLKFRPIGRGNRCSLLSWHLKCLIDAPLEVGGKSRDSTCVGGIQVHTQRVNKGGSGF